MTDDDAFNNALIDALAKVLPGQKNKDTVEKLLDGYSYDLRKVALAPDNRGVRRANLDKIETKLLKELAKLADTEHDEQPGQEQPGEQPAHDDQEQPGPAAPEPAPSAEQSKRKRKRN